MRGISPKFRVDVGPQCNIRSPFLRRALDSTIWLIYSFNLMVDSESARPDEDAALDRIFHALSDGTRRQIVELLREAGELRVSDLADAFSMSLNGVSKHVKVLEGAGLLQRRVEWREHWLRINPQALAQAYAWVHFHHHFWAERLHALGEMFETPTKKDNES